MRRANGESFLSQRRWNSVPDHSAPAPPLSKGERVRGRKAIWIGEQSPNTLQGHEKQCAVATQRATPTTPVAMGGGAEGDGGVRES